MIFLFSSLKKIVYGKTSIEKEMRKMFCEQFFFRVIRIRDEYSWKAS